MAAVGVAVVEDEVELDVAALTMSEAAPTRTDCPSKVTRAFSVAQERLFELNRAISVLAERGMEKLVCAPVISREIESPNVTLADERPESVVVVHPVAFAEVHVDPVKPLVQMHAQVVPSKILEPPFLHDVVESASHFCTADSVLVLDGVFL